MSVYVDDLRPIKCWPEACHMLADTDRELDQMAALLCLLPRWKHGDHYDLSPSKRALAVKAGATEVTSRQLVEIRRASLRRMQRSEGQF